MRVNGGFSEACQIGRGVRQGCSLSPLLYIIYILYDKELMKEATENVQAGISVGGATVSLIRHADDKDVAASSPRGMQYLMDNINEVSKEYHMKINTKRQRSCVFYVKGTTNLGSVLIANK